MQNAPNARQRAKMAKKRLQQKPKPKGLPLWLGTFGDLMSLLLTFFILLLSMATFDKEKVDAAIGSLQGALSILERGRETEITTPSQIQATPIQTQSEADVVLNLFSSLISEYNEMTQISDGPGIDLEESQDGFLLRIPSDLLFSTGSAELDNPNGRLLLNRIALELNKIPLKLRIIGHTDDVKYRVGSNIDNWDLSNARALSVADIFLNKGVDSSKIEVGGDGDFNPVVPNDSELNRAKNRRVELHFSFVGDSKDLKNKAENQIKTLINANP